MTRFIFEITKTCKKKNKKFIRNEIYYKYIVRM